MFSQRPNTYFPYHWYLSDAHNLAWFWNVLCITEVKSKLCWINWQIHNGPYFGPWRVLPWNEYALGCYFGVYSPRCFATLEKVNFSWAAWIVYHSSLHIIFPRSFKQQKRHPVIHKHRMCLILVPGYEWYDKICVIIGLGHGLYPTLINTNSHIRVCITFNVKYSVYYK